MPAIASPATFKRELRSLALGALLALALGLLVGQPTLLLLLFVSAHLVRQLYQLHRLLLWLRRDERGAIPTLSGPWAEAYGRHRRIKEAQRERRRRLAHLLINYRESTRAIPDATVVLTSNFEIEWFNTAAGRLLGLRPRSDFGRRIDNLVRHPIFTEHLQCGTLNVDAEFPSPINPSVILAVRLSPYRGRNDRLLLTARDVTDRVQVDRIRRDFVANVSHELRTPLTVFSGFLETMEKSDDPCTERWRRPLLLMRQQTDRMRSMVEDLLILAKLESGRERERRLTRPVVVPQLLETICNDARALSDGRHTLITEIDEELYLLGVEEELRAAFSNLLFNAVQYTSEGGTISLRWLNSDEGPLYQVIDTGIGIEQHHIPRLTERFFRVDVARSRKRGGTGLGLAIVRHVLERHEAHLTIDSEVGRGSTFTCHFPAASAAAP